jgi:hypothetical protein
MRVVADASPLHSLILLEQTAISPTLFERVVIPPAVVGALRHPRTPAPVRTWMRHLSRCGLQRARRVDSRKPQDFGWEQAKGRRSVSLGNFMLTCY